MTHKLTLDPQLGSTSLLLPLEPCYAPAEDLAPHATGAKRREGGRRSSVTRVSISSP